MKNFVVSKGRNVAGSGDQRPLCLFTEEPCPTSLPLASLSLLTRTIPVIEGSALGHDSGDSEGATDLVAAAASRSFSSCLTSSSR